MLQYRAAAKPIPMELEKRNSRAAKPIPRVSSTFKELSAALIWKTLDIT